MSTQMPDVRYQDIGDGEDLGAEELVARAVEKHHPRLVLASSFQKEESVLLHILMRLAPDAKVFTIDTGVLFEETVETWREVEHRYGVKVEVFDATSPDAPWSGPDHCCGEAKVAALGKALTGREAWITGMRREQAPTRTTAPKVGWDEKHALWKYNPLADWTEKDVWSFIHEHDLPYNELHDQGYASIGCAPCTQPGSGRDGRWAGRSKTECGIHVVGADA
jgi:phosphoadenosine phosphosulfate reductase